MTVPTGRIAARRGELLYQTPVTAREMSFWKPATPTKTSADASQTATCHWSARRNSACTSPMTTRAPATQSGAPYRGLPRMVSVTARATDSSGGWS